VKTLFRVETPPQRREFVLRVSHEVGAEEHRGYVLFDDNDYPDYPILKWRKRALHLDLRCGVDEAGPEHILKLMNSPDCDHFVWLSKRIAESEPVHMVRVYAHELRHVIQGTLYSGLSKLTAELTVSLQKSPPEAPRTLYSIELPQELDAELAAWQLVRSVFGDDEYVAYRSREIANNAKAADYFRRFDELASSWRDDPIAETRRLLLSRD